jgi:hypothetical protein
MNRRRTTLLFALGGIGLFLALRPEPLLAAWKHFARLVSLTGKPLPASTARISEHDREQLATLPRERQAELLLERSISGFEGANEEIERRLDGWYGIPFDQSLWTKFNIAMNSADLRVRAAAIEIYLAAANHEEASPEQEEEEWVQIVQDAGGKKEDRTWGLWYLGMLGNRQEEPDRIRSVLIEATRDPEVDVRAAATNGLGILGGLDTIPALLEVLRADASAEVRERAACGLAQSGFFTKDERLLAVPGLVEIAGTRGIDEKTRHWSYLALREITGESLPDVAGAWRGWWEERKPAAPIAER